MRAKNMILHGGEIKLVQSISNICSKPKYRKLHGLEALWFAIQSDCKYLQPRADAVFYFAPKSDESWVFSIEGEDDCILRGNLEELEKEILMLRENLGVHMIDTKIDVDQKELMDILKDKFNNSKKRKGKQSKSKVIDTASEIDKATIARVKVK
jgi:hypothetical protein